jgi:hypothetical protein
MTKPKFHHYVPRFYLDRFSDEDGYIWAYDKFKDKVLRVLPENIAGENKFYDLTEFQGGNIDPLELEKQFSDLESEASKITASWFYQLDSYDMNVIEIPPINREIMSLFLTLQMLRTVSMRNRIIQFTKAVQKGGLIDKSYDPDQDANALHASLLWDDKLVKDKANKVSDCIWAFAHNNTDNMLYTSDHPLLIKTADSKNWISGPQVFKRGMYIVFPLSPDWIMYCHDESYWDKLTKFNNSISPVVFTSYMVDHENSGQVGLSYRFVFSNTPNFEFAKMFCQLHPEIKDPKRKHYEWSTDD